MSSEAMSDESVLNPIPLEQSQTATPVASTPSTAAPSSTAPSRGRTGVREIPSNPEISREPSMMPQEGTVLGISMVLVTGLAVLLRRSRTKPEQRPFFLGRFHPNIPCRNCRFKSDNTHLKCAVHPSKVMKKEATDCPDYWPKNSDRFCR